jgi:signal transduction histidine kinase
VTAKAGQSELRQAFEQAETEERCANFGRALFWGSIFSLLGGILDIFVYPLLAWEFAFARVIIVGLFCVGLIPWFNLRKPKNLTAMSHYIAIVPQAAIFWMIFRSGEAASSYYAGISLVLVGTSLILRWRFIDNLINALICLVSYAFLLIYLGADLNVFIAHTFFVFATGAFASVGAYFSNELRFSEFILRKKLEDSRETLSGNNEKLKALDEAKTRFFANMSHELRTPLTLILGPIDQLAKRPELQTNPKSKQIIETLSENGLRLLRLINDLLDLARLDTDELPSRVENIDLKDFIEGIARSIGAMAQTKQIQIDVESDLERHPIQPLDRDRLEKILLNLTINALKFSKPGTRLSLSLKENNTHISINIQDQGVGIAEDELPYIFERFWQGDSSAKRKTRGTGIGLALAKNLTESMGGTITVESTLGEGTSFLLSFPILKPLDVSSTTSETTPDAQDRFDDLHEKALFQTPLSTQQHVGISPEHPDGPQSGNSEATILIVDDETGMRSFISSQLDTYRIMEAADGRQGLSLAKQYLPNLIILDYMMPEIDGIELAEMLKKDPSTARIPIILLTAHAGDGPRIAALNAGVNDFLTKPFSSTELQSRVKNILSTVRFERDLAQSNDDLNVALEQLREQEEALVRSEKLSSLGQMSAGIVHEINNPLNYAKTSLHILKTFQKLLPTEEHEDYLDTLADLEDAVMRVIGIVTDLRAFTRGDETVKGQISLSQVLRNAQRLLSADLETVNLETNIPEEITILGNDNQLCQAFVNLIQNALHATENVDQPKIDIHALRTGGGDLIVTVRDNGYGIPEEVISKIFDPFFTTKDVGVGMGLGLSLTMRIIEDHGGRLTAESRQGQGTEFTLYFSS